MECMLPEIVQPLYPIRMNKSDIREPERISNSIIAHGQKKKYEFKYIGLIFSAFLFYFLYCIFIKW